MSKNSAELQPEVPQEPESPSVPYAYRLQGHYLSAGRVITVSHGSRDVILDTPTPLTAPPIDDHPINLKPRALRYTSDNFPYLLFVSKYEPWGGALFDVLDYTWQEPTTRTENGNSDQTSPRPGKILRTACAQSGQ
ncbi:hypothetical protein K438DRAFT_2019964 [Mycena galopus ATCC 62051]|nr:hypothetical protein K438DRAFT_2019964 [Mycena galopus ATCC 62051]